MAGRIGRRWLANVLAQRTGPWRALRTIAIAAGVGLVAASTSAAPGDLDPTFGTDGQVIESFGPSEERPSSAVLQPDGKIVVGGTVLAGGQSQFLVARFDATGALDPMFGSGGSVMTMGNGPNDQLAALLLQPDGKIVAVGLSAIVRYTSDGSLDPSFGTAGKVVFSIGPARGSPYGALLQPDGKIVVAGVAYDPAIMFALARFEADGSVDTAFGVNGEVLSDVSPSFDSGLSTALQPDGKVLLAGTCAFQFSSLATTRTELSTPVSAAAGPCSEDSRVIRGRWHSSPTARSGRGRRQ